MSEELSKVANKHAKLLGLLKEVQVIYQGEDRKIADLEWRVDDVEQYFRIDDLIISGLKTRHQTYTRKGEDALPSDKLRDRLNGTKLVCPQWH